MQYTYSAFPRLASVAADWRWRLARLAILSLVVLLVLNGVAMMAQERFGSISGVVTDSTKASIPGVKVTVTNREIGKSLSTTSGTDGSYILRELEPGRYVVRFERTGFTAAEVADVNLLVGKELRIDQTLSVGSTTETVQVTESAPLSQPPNPGT